MKIYVEIDGVLYERVKDIERKACSECDMKSSGCMEVDCEKTIYKKTNKKVVEG